MKTRKLTLILLCVIITATSFFTTAFADWYDDVKSGCTWVEIEGDEFVIDTFCGVEARYNESDYYYQCNELIMRFYREAYGLDVMAYMNTGLIMLTDGYGFVEAEVPQKGDIIYVTAGMRNSGSDHWAIVKDYSNGYITMFEQNVLWEGKGALNRQIKWPSESYYLLTPVSLGSAPAPVLRGVEEEATTTTKPTTTAKPTTTKPTTTAAPTTVTTTVATTAVSATVPTTVTTTMLISDAETAYLSLTETEEYPVYSETEISTETVPAENESDSGSDAVFALPVAVICGVLAVLVTATIIIIKKKK